MSPGGLVSSVRQLKIRTIVVLALGLMMGVGAQALPVALELDLAVPAASPLDALTDTEALVDDLLAASPGDALRRAAAASGQDVPAATAPALSLVEGLVALSSMQGAPFQDARIAALESRVADLPAALQVELARLVSSMVAAYELRAAAIADLDDDEVAFLMQHIPLALTAGEHGWAHESTAAATDAVSLPQHDQASGDATRERVAQLAERVDAAYFTAGAALLVDAAMEALPALRSIADSLPGTATPASHGCDVFEEAPYICVRGTGDDAWHRDWWLAVDLGGDDLYQNSQGATTDSIPVSLLLDVSGNDAYVAPLDGAEILAQGAAALGVGVLVDGGGVNTYSAIAAFAPPPLTPAPPVPVVMAQGAAALGAGVLVDLGDGASFVAEAATLGAAATMSAQGAARLGGVGMLYSAGSAGTVYTATSASDFLLTHETPTSRTYAAGPASTVAQGAAEGGVGLLVDLAGDDVYRAESRGSSATTTAQGAAELGAGVLLDVGGADERSAHAVVDAVLDSEFVVTCAPGFICSATNTVTVTMGGARTTAQGAANSGVGVLAFLAGDGDVNDAVARSEPLGRSGVSFGGGGGLAGTFHAVANVIAGAVEVYSHGSAMTGLGALLSLGTGDDTYGIVAASNARAIAQSTGGSTNTAQASATGGNAEPRGQGFAALGAGILKDVDGADRYLVSASATATATQNGAPGATSPGAVTWGGRALAEGGVALAVLLDLGGTDVYGGVPGSAFGGANDTCWSNSPPGVTDLDTRIAIGVDAAAPFASLLDAPCFPLPPN